MGLTERHWFENEDVPENYEWALEDAVYNSRTNKKADTLAPLKEQEAGNGEWITIWREDDPDTSTHARCSICNRISERPLGVYCKWCGAKMTL